jgi:hypothetical protein
LNCKYEGNNSPLYKFEPLLQELLNQAAELARQYFKRLCRWDNVTDLSTVKLFGYDLGPIDEELSQIAVFQTQGIEGNTSLLYCDVGFC